MKTKVRKMPVMLLFAALAAAALLLLFFGAGRQAGKVQRTELDGVSARYGVGAGIIRKVQLGETGRIPSGGPGVRGIVKSGIGADGAAGVLEKPEKKDCPEISARYNHGGAKIAKAYHGEVGKLTGIAHRDGVKAVPNVRHRDV